MSAFSLVLGVALVAAGVAFLTGLVGGHRFLGGVSLAAGACAFLAGRYLRRLSGRLLEAAESGSDDRLDDGPPEPSLERRVKLSPVYAIPVLISADVGNAADGTAMAVVLAVVTAGIGVFAILGPPLEPLSRSPFVRMARRATGRRRREGP